MTSAGLLSPRKTGLTQVGWDYGATLAVEVVTLSSGLLLFHLIATRMGSIGFAYYQVGRGMIAALVPLALVGLVVSVQRSLPKAGAAAWPLARRVFGFHIGASTLLLTMGLLVGDQVSHLLGLRGGTGAILAVLCSLSGICLLAHATASLRGIGQVGQANLGSIAGLSIAALVSFALTTTVASFMLVHGLLMAVIAACFMLPDRRTIVATGDGATVPTLGGMLGYGVRRLPGDLALPALFTYPTFFVSATTRGGAEAGHVGFTTSAVTMICSLFAILSPVLIPRLSRHFGSVNGIDSWFWNKLRLLPLVAAALAVIAVVTLSLGAPLIVRAYLGSEFLHAVPAFRIGLIAAIPLAAFYAARPVIDAMQDSPITTKLLLGCFAVEVAATYLLAHLLNAPLAAMTAMALAAALLGVLSFIALARVAAPAGAVSS